MERRIHPAHLQAALHRLHAVGRNLVARLPGDRPAQIVYELRGSYPTRARRPPWRGIPVLSELVTSEPSLEELAADVEQLADAPWLVEVTFRMQGLRVDFATAFALRQAIGRLRAAGKRVRCWLAELDVRDYYVASAAERVIVPPSADVRLLGFGASVTFLRDALERLGLELQKLAIGDYKDAFDTFVRSEMSPAQREQLEAILDSFERGFVVDVAADRRLTPEAVRSAMNEGVISAERARELGLVDEVKYEDEVLGPEHRTMAAATRFFAVRPVPVTTPRVAIVQLQGLIVTGPSRRVPLGSAGFGHVTAGADSIARALRAAAGDPTTAAVVLAVNSGGGSALASDLLWREVRRLDDRKPVVAVLGAVAASGGYYVAAGARRIIAAPATITGSIGVVTAKLVLRGLYERLGVRVEQLRRGRFALWHDPSSPLDEPERAMLERGNRQSYERFLARVSEGRCVPVDRIEPLARGRVWTGAQALEHGLCDELGDIEQGIARAAALAGIEPPLHAWTVRAPAELLLPNAEDPTTLGRALGSLGRETSLALEPRFVTIG